jgi:hypothetical protein
MPRKLVVFTALAGFLAAAPMAAFAKDAKKESENFFDITDEVEEAGGVVKTGANKTVGFFEGLFDDDNKDDGKKKKK